MTDSAKQDAPQANMKQADAEQADAEQADAEQADAEATSAHAEDDEGKPDLDEVKRQFREALDRKREQHANGSGQGGRDAGKIHGSQGPATSRRSFRRKSG
jgi:DNA anti-recombination protein RmuC